MFQTQTISAMHQLDFGVLSKMWVISAWLVGDSLNSTRWLVLQHNKLIKKQRKLYLIPTPNQHFWHNSFSKRYSEFLKEYTLFNMEPSEIR